MGKSKKIIASVLTAFMLASTVVTTAPASSVKIVAKTKYQQAKMKKNWSGYTTNGMPTFIEKGCTIEIINMNSISAYYCRYKTSVGGDYTYVYIPPTYIKM